MARPISDIADRFDLSISGLNMSLHRFKLKQKKDRQLQDAITAIEEKCKNG